MPLKGVSRVRSSYSRVIRDITTRRSRLVVSAIIATGAAWAKMYTPVDTSALINSQRRLTSNEGSAVVGRVWYSQDYATWLENSDKWRPIKKKSAKPHFLKSGFEDEGPVSEINEIIRNGYKL